MAISKSEMELLALDFRKDAGVIDPLTPFDPLNLRIDGISVTNVDSIAGLDPKVTRYLKTDGVNFWSAMTVPLDAHQEKWVIVLNTSHEKKRQRPSLLEELWHIFLGHKLTRITKIGSLYGRSFDSDNEHDAYYLGAATLLTQPAIHKFLLNEKRDIEKFAEKYGVSKDLVEYRIKRLGLWRKYAGHHVSIASNSLI